MAYPAVVLRVMLSAPSDVDEELEVMRQVVQRWNRTHSEAKQVVLLPLDYRADAYPEVGSHPQHTVNRQLLAKCEILVAAFWSRIGTATGDHPSGTVEEIDLHVRAHKPALLYFSTRPTDPSQLDLDQLAAVRRYKEQMKSEAFYHEFDSPVNFSQLLTDDLARLMNESEYIQTQLRPFVETAPQTLDPVGELNELAKKVLALAATGKGQAEGRVILHRFDQGTGLMAGTTSVSPTVTGRKEAEIAAVIATLVSHGLIYDSTGQGQLFQLTERGYAVADSLPPSYHQ